MVAMVTIYTIHNKENSQGSHSRSCAILSPQNPSPFIWLLGSHNVITIQWSFFIIINVSDLFSLYSSLFCNIVCIKWRIYPTHNMTDDYFKHFIIKDNTQPFGLNIN